MDYRRILSWLKQKELAELKKLWDKANRTRLENVGNQIHLRGLVEFSNICSRKCVYCGINAVNRKLRRYQMSGEEILECARTARKLGYGTVVLQSGENKKLDIGFLAGVIRSIKQNTNLAITLSVGEWSKQAYQLWKQAGADRYLLKFETSDTQLYKKLCPDNKIGVAERFDRLKILEELGYEIGSGIMIGIPGQSYESLADDLLKFKELDLDMIGVGPYIRHHDTELGRNNQTFLLDSENQVPAAEEMTYKVIALSRLLCPQTNIPSTTALATLNPRQGQEYGLKCGANVVMPNITPGKYRKMYDIYPAKTCSFEKAETYNARIIRQIEKIGRTVGSGRGDSLRFLEKARVTL